MTMAWTDLLHTFADEIFLKTLEFVITTQRAFYMHFMLSQNNAILDRKLFENLIWYSIILT